MSLSGLDYETTLAQFNRLMQELERGEFARTVFQQWEVTLLLDIESCHLPDRKKRETLRRYQRAVNRLFLHGAAELPTLSEFLKDPRLRSARRY